MSKLTVWVLVVATMLASGCSLPMQQNDWNAYDGPGKEAFLQEEMALPIVRDPVEPMNRGVGMFNFGLVYGVFAPVAAVYRFIIPKPVRHRVTNVFDNLHYPVRLVGNSLQGQWSEAWTETKRFGINTTVGLLGIFDPAAAHWEIEAPPDTDVGKAFDSWGWEDTAYLQLPILGPSTVRDATALPFDFLLDPATYLFPAGTVRTVNNGSDKVKQYKSFVHTNYDPYALGKLLWVRGRDADTSGYEIVHGDGGAPLETLGAVYLNPKDPDFRYEARCETVLVPGTGRKLPYSLWLQEKPAPMFFFLPGLGGHRDASSSIAMAELAYDHGFSAVTISNAMNWEFMEFASTAAVPGYGPVDSRDVHSVIDTIRSDLGRRYPHLITKNVLAGVSLGAFHTLFIAAAEGQKGNVYRPFDRYLAINPPVRLSHGLQKLDDFYNAPTALPEEERLDFVDKLFGQVIVLLQKGVMEHPENLNLTKMQAEFVIGLAFRATLATVILSSQDRIDLGVLKTERTKWRRTSALLEIREFSYAEYMYAFALPYYQGVDPEIRTVEDMLGRCDMRRYTDALRANENVRVFTNEDDFLNVASDRAWIVDTFGEQRVAIDERGGHLGNLYEPEVQETLMGFVRDIAPR